MHDALFTIEFDIGNGWELDRSGTASTCEAAAQETIRLLRLLAPQARYRIVVTCRCQPCRLRLN